MKNPDHRYLPPDVTRPAPEPPAVETDAAAETRRRMAAINAKPVLQRPRRSFAEVLAEVQRERAALLAAEVRS